MDFKDNFSKLSSIYAKYRPSAPAELFSYLNSIVEDHDLVLDCGTGNGQAAIQLVEYFDKVVATDPSTEQLKFAPQHTRVKYLNHKAEDKVLQPATADLVTVSQALHWFDFDLFYAEVKRILKPNGMIAVWAYPLPTVETKLDNAIHFFHENVVGEFWQYENRMIDKAYSNIPFPFKEIETPVFKIEKEFSFDDLIGLLHTWSAVQKYKEIHGKDPVGEYTAELRSLWKEDEMKFFTWTLILKIGKNS